MPDIEQTLTPRPGTPAVPAGTARSPRLGAPALRTARSPADEPSARARALVEQYRVDAEIAATERSIERFAVDGRALYPGLDILDPYFLATAAERTVVRRVLETVIDRTAADRVTLQVNDPHRRGLVLAEHSAVLDDTVRAGTSAARPRMLSVPLVTAGGRVLGVLSCHYRTPARGDDRRLLTVLARALVRSLQSSWSPAPRPRR